MFGFKKFEENAKKKNREERKKMKKNKKIDFKSINYCFPNLELLIV